MGYQGGWQEMKIVAGVDGGGTKTKVICQDLQGQVIAEESLGAFNLNSIGEEGLTTRLKEICEFLQSQGACVSLCIGAAGVSNPRMQELVERVMEQADIKKWKLVGDDEIALWGALEGKTGIALVAGTGSICCGRNAKGENLHVGGWGHLIGDEGSGYAIGRDVIKAVTHFWDGYGEQTCLTDLLTEQLHLDDRQKIITYVYKNDKSHVAQLSRLAETAAARRDVVALHILQDNACQVSHQVAAVAKRLHLEKGEVALLGGLLENDTLYRKVVMEEIEKNCPGFTCVAPKQNAAMGAVMMAKAMLGENK